MLHLLPITLVMVSILVAGFGSTPSQAEDVDSIMERAKREAAKMSLPANRYNQESLKAAQESAKLFNSPEFQERVHCEEQRLANKVFTDSLAPWKQARKNVEEKSSTLAATETIYLFFSSSVPEDTIRAYLSTIAKVDDPKLVPVMRGWVHGLADTGTAAEYFSRILQKDPACQGARTPCDHYQVQIQLQPSLFSKYTITQVPAVVYTNDQATYRIQGDAGLDYLLERINREAMSSVLNNLIRTIRTL